MNTVEMKWHYGTPGVFSLLNEVHVWRMCLDVTTLHMESLLENLSADEVARAGRFHFNRDRKRFIVARGMLRQLLGCYLGESPHKLRFEYTSHGKPLLAMKSGYDPICFNISHSGVFALCAFTEGRNIGIDIERVRDDIAVEQIARNFFSPGEISAFNRISKNNQQDVFFQYWTRKEALLKAIGEGLCFSMEQCDVSLMNGSILSPISILNNNRDVSHWYGQDLFPQNGYAAAIAVEGGDWDLSCWHFAI